MAKNVRQWFPAEQMNENGIPLELIQGYRYVTEDGSGDVEVLVEGEWYCYSSGPTVDDDVAYLKTGNIPQLPNKTEPYDTAISYEPGEKELEGYAKRAKRDGSDFLDNDHSMDG